MLGPIETYKTRISSGGMDPLSPLLDPPLTLHQHISRNYQCSDDLLWLVTYVISTVNFHKGLIS